MDVLVSFLNPGAPGQPALGVLDAESLDFRLLRLPPELPARSGITGVAQSADYLFAVLQVSRGGAVTPHFAPPALLTFDRSTLRLLSEYTFPSARDVHSICLHGDRLYVVSTGTDEVLALRLDGPRVIQETVFWRPDASYPREDFHHLNSVCSFDGNLLVSGFGRKSGPLWSSALDGFVVNASRGAVIARGLSQPHSLLAVDGAIGYCESGKENVQIGHDLSIGDLHGYTRGLCGIGGKLFVGTSARRQISKSTGRPLTSSGPEASAFCRVSRLSPDTGDVEKTADLSEHASEIYDLLPVDGTALWPLEVAPPGNPEAGWRRQVEKATIEILDIVPPGKTFVLMDEDRWGTERDMRGRLRLPFLQRHGQYWGPPADDETAVREMEELRGAGAGYVVVGWPAFWWLDSYPTLHDYLRSHFHCVAENDRIVAFEKTA